MPTPTIREVNVLTGEEIVRAATPEEVAAFQAAAAQAAAPVAPPLPTVDQIRAALKAAGETDAQIDALFALAAAI